MRRSQMALALIAILSFITGGWLVRRAPQGGVYSRARMFDAVLTHVADFYVDSLSEPALYDMAIDGMLEELHDPYTVMLRGEDFRDLTTIASGNYGGIGAQIDVRDGWITIVAPLPDTPAERAGILTGDRVVAVNDTSTRDWSPDKGLAALRGDPGSTVRLTVARAGASTLLKFQITRAEIHVRSVQLGTVVAPGVGYVQLTVVSDSSSDELAQAIDRLRAQGARGIVLDLRNNPGGLLDEAVRISELFLDKGQEIVDTRGRAPGANETVSADKTERWPGLPVVVLVDGGTASAAEIIAGALQDHDRAVLVGERTFGKGLVQEVFPLGTDEALKITTSRWFTPSGRSIQRQHEDDLGVSQAPHAGTATDTARRFRTDQGRLMAGGGGILPDVVIPADTLSPADREFFRTLGAGLPAYRDVLTAYALDVRARGSVTSPAFSVTPAMVSDVRARLAARHVVLPDAVWRGAGTLIAQQVGDEIARYALGRDGAFRRGMPGDADLQRAIALLTRAHSPAELLKLVPQGPTTPAKRP